MSKRLAEGAVTTAQRRPQRLGEAPTLAGKVVLVTGASSGIGRAIALACAEAGADAVRRTLGGVGGWINSAGADIRTGEGARLSWTEKLDRLLAVDLRGTVLASWTAVALMRDQPGGGRASRSS